MYKNCSDSFNAITLFLFGLIFVLPFFFFGKEETFIICFLLTFYFDYQHLQLVGWFHLCHLCAILHIRWQDKICSKNILGHKSLSGFEATILTAQTCGAAHVTETEDTECQSSCRVKERGDHTVWAAHRPREQKNVWGKKKVRLQAARNQSQSSGITDSRHALTRWLGARFGKPCQLTPR